MMLKRILSCFLVTSMSACTTTEVEQSNSTAKEKIIFDVKEKDRGKIVHEIFEKISHDFYYVRRSIENPPSHWEGVGHFSFIFFKQKEICQCSPFDTSISPNGRYLLYSNQSEGGALEVFDSNTLSSKVLSNIYIGYPITAQWNLDENSVLVTWDKYDSNQTSRTFMLGS